MGYDDYQEYEVGKCHNCAFRKNDKCIFYPPKIIAFSHNYTRSKYPTINGDGCSKHKLKKHYTG